MRRTVIEVKIKASPGRQNIDQAGIYQVTHGPKIKADFRRRAERVKAFQEEKVGVKTGLLKSTIRVEQSADATTDVIAGRAGVTKYLGYHHDGTSPHEIRPRRARALAWVGAGGYVIRARVSHPGNKSNPFVKESAKFWAD